MTADELVDTLGQALVGRRVDTWPLGLWTGGVCEVTKIAPDPSCPEIAFEMRRVSDGEEIGVFGYEPVTLCK